MPSNPKRSGTGASQSFTKPEVEGMCSLFEILARGGDVSILVRSKELQHVRTKFHRMRQSINEGRSGIGGPGNSNGGTPT